MTDLSSNNHVSVFPYPGGKGRESDWIISKMPPHDCYVEVFGGSGAILYNKPASHNEVYNDANYDLVQFFEMLRTREDDLVEWLNCVPYARSVYDKWADAYYEGFRPADPIERAGRFFALRHMQFAGDNSMKNGFKVRNYRTPARTFNNARKRLHEIAGRFGEVIIECRDWLNPADRQVLLEGYDADWDDPEEPDVLYYMDPPYIGNEDYYGVTFDHDEFVDSLSGLGGRWMVSYTELPQGLEDYNVMERERRHRMTRGDSIATERLACNFDPADEPSFVNLDERQESLVAFEVSE